MTEFRRRTRAARLVGRTLRAALAGVAALCCTLGLLPASLAAAQAVPTAGPSAGGAVQRPVQPQPPRLPFYVATRGRVTIYLLGTLHTAEAADYPADRPFRPAIVGALHASAKLAFELSPDDLSVSQNDVTRYGVCPHDCLQKLLPDALWRKLAYRLRDDPAALEDIRKVRPWLASLLIETFDSLSAGLRTEYGTEAQLENLYTKETPILGLETLNDEMRAFTSLRLAEQWEMLAQDLAQTPAQNAADVRQLHRLWRDGDADALAAWAAAKSERLAQTPDLAKAIDEKILYRRNRHFVTRMLALTAPDRPLFVAIGALHLGGPRGVLARLRMRGFKVERE